MHLSMVHSAQRHPRRACAPTVLRRWMPDGPRRQPSHRSVPAVSPLRRHFNSITLTMNIAIGAPRPLRAVSVQRPSTTMRPQRFFGDDAALECVSVSWCEQWNRDEWLLLYVLVAALTEWSRPESSTGIPTRLRGWRASQRYYDSLRLARSFLYTPIDAPWREEGPSGSPRRPEEGAGEGAGD